MVLFRGRLPQALARSVTATPDLEWLRGHLRDEFAAWLNPSSARVCLGRLPEYLIVTTNVRLTCCAMRCTIMSLSARRRRRQADAPFNLMDMHRLDPEDAIAGIVRTAATLTQAAVCDTATTDRRHRSSPTPG
jgi:hypothetical protein